MSNAPHPITLSHVVFTKVNVAAIAQHQSTDGGNAGAIDNHLQVDESVEEKRTYQAVMRTIVNKDASADHPYVIDVECHGVFRVDDTLSDEDARRGVTITAHSVLYGAIRETVAWLTSRQPYGVMMLGLSVLVNPAPAAARE